MDSALQFHMEALGFDHVFLSMAIRDADGLHWDWESLMDAAALCCGWGGI